MFHFFRNDTNKTEDEQKHLAIQKTIVNELTHDNNKMMMMKKMVMKTRAKMKTHRMRINLAKSNTDRDLFKS
jgi:hypothetical protein